MLGGVWQEEDEEKGRWERVMISDFFLNLFWVCDVFHFSFPFLPSFFPPDLKTFKSSSPQNIHVILIILVSNEQ